VRTILPGRHLILRVAFLYGAGGRSLIRTVVRAAAEHPYLDVVDDQVGNPTWTVDVGRATAALLDTEAAGLVHVASPDHASKHEVAEAAVEFARAHLQIRPLQQQRPLKVRQVRPVSTTSRHDLAQRPRYSALDTTRLHTLTGLQFPPWRQSLRAFIDAHLDELLAL
jgi:dTDP-4-dehydrorhamnose reductase